MHRLIEQIRTPEFETAHPVLQASYCHYAFVVIHPFADGNGRVARALASTFFYRTQSIPLVIFENQRPTYLDALARADQGDPGLLILFFQDRGIDTMQLVSESLMTAATPKPENLAVNLDRASKIWRHFYDSELKATSDRILLELAEQFLKKVKALNFKSLSADWEHGNREWSTAGKRFVATVVLRLRSTEPRLEVSVKEVSIFYSLKFEPFPFLIRDVYETQLDDLEVRLEDVISELTPHFRLRLDQWVQRQLGRMLVEIARKSVS